MPELLTAAQMRAAETAVIASGAASGLEFMERAGRGVVEALLREWPALRHTQERAVVLCGPGNNGGDGFVVARLLHDKGLPVEVLMLGDAGKLPPDARENHDRWLRLGHVTLLSDVGTALEEGLQAAPPALVVDALFGTGLSRPLEGAPARALAGIAEWRDRQDIRPPVVAVDLPSGVCSDSGRDLGGPLPADLTVTFHSAKPGHYLDGGPAMCGALRVVDIGLPRGAHPDTPPDEVAQLAAPAPLGKGAAHKYDHGHALVLSGGAGRTGAARLAARGALRVGAGLVTLAVPPSAQMEVAAHVTAIMLRRVEDGDALSGVLEDARLNALCLGPGLGLDDRAAELVSAALEGQRPTVLDADALTLMARTGALFERLHADCVLTPHFGEFARLFPDLAEAYKEKPTGGPALSRIDITREAAARAGCTVLLKGPDTIVAAPDGTCRVNAAVHDRAAPWLATAGAGDVLSGLIAGLLARGVAPFDAAVTGAWLHVEAARRFGPGLIAEDLPEALPGVFRDLGL